MCIIVVKPAGKPVDKSILENCFANNDDGAGYMYPCEGKVLIQKGFFAFKEFWTSWEKTHARVGDDVPVVFHFRISTSGHLDKTNCHPHRIASHIGKGNKFVFLNGEGKHVICNQGKSTTFIDGLAIESDAFQRQKHEI